MYASLSERIQAGMQLAADFLSTPRIDFRDLKPSDLPVKPGVYAIFSKDTGETLSVGQTKNIRQRLYNNHLHGPFRNGRRLESLLSCLFNVKYMYEGH